MKCKIERAHAPIKKIKIKDKDLEDFIQIYPIEDCFQIEILFKSNSIVNSGELEYIGKMLIELANQGSYRDPHRKNET